jgi:hypothetical protein
MVAGSSRRVTSVAIWTDAKSASFTHALQTYTVLGLLLAGLKMFCGLAAEARSCTCMKAYLINASDPVLTVSIEFGIQEQDPARAAHIIVQRMKADAKGVLLHKCEPLYLRCGNVFESCPSPSDSWLWSMLLRRFASRRWTLVQLPRTGCYIQRCKPEVSRQCYWAAHGACVRRAIHVEPHLKTGLVCMRHSSRLSPV